MCKKNFWQPKCFGIERKLHVMQHLHVSAPTTFQTKIFAILVCFKHVGAIARHRWMWDEEKFGNFGYFIVWKIFSTEISLWFAETAEQHFLAYSFNSERMDFRCCCLQNAATMLTITKMFTNKMCHSLKLCKHKLAIHTQNAPHKSILSHCLDISAV